MRPGAALMQRHRWRRTGLRVWALALAAAAAGARSAEPPAPRACAWAARKDDAIVHLVGTVHAGMADQAKHWPVELETCWHRTDTLLVEADTSDAAAIAALVQRHGIAASAAEAWGDRCTETLRERLRRSLGELPPEADRMRPWLLMQAVVAAHLAQHGFHSHYGLDARLVERAREERRRIVEIEGAEHQFRIFAHAPFEIQVAMLTDALDDIESGEAAREVRRIMEVCETGDVDALERLYSELAGRTRPADRYLFRRLFDERHPAMVRAIEQSTAYGARPLVAVGALHFVGPKGLIAQLRRRGWTVERIQASSVEPAEAR